MSKLDPGKLVEKQVNDWLQARSATEAGFAFHRYPDARSAQGPLAAQPADFLVGRKTPYGRSAFHIEAKETAEPRRLPKSKIRQYGMLKKFDWAGFETRIIVYRSVSKDWVFFTGRDIFDFEDCPASFVMTDLQAYHTHHEALKAIFG